MSQIAESLKKLFDSHRVIFWHDEKAELLDSFQELVLPEVECLQVNNNEFFIKHRVVKQVPGG